MTATEAGNQGALRQIVEELRSIRLRLRELVGSLPVSPGEDDLVEELDIATEIRSVVECVLADQIEPAIRDLTAATGHRPPGPA